METQPYLKGGGLSLRCLRDSDIGYVPGEIVTDIDGNNYETCQIGTQIWLAKSLATTKYNDGTPIPEITDGAAWAAAVGGARCSYNNDPNNI